jgi:O-antigen/teichoic acid export membrane protein
MSMPGTRKSAVRSGIQTGVSMLAISGSAAVAGALVAQKFGRDAETDGFLAAYAIYLVLVLAAQAFRLVVVPDLTRAAAQDRLGAETRAYALTFLALAVPVVVLVALLSGPAGDALPGGLPEESANLAGRALVWLVPAAFMQMLASLAASALAARDSYGVAAFGYAGGAVIGLALFLALADAHGLISLAWGLFANGAFSLGVPTIALLARGHLRGGRASIVSVRTRIGTLLRGAAVPLAIQGLYLISLRLATALGVGEVTSLSYAYLLAATLVTATASALSLVSAATLTRRGLDDVGAARHVVHASWLSLALIAGAGGVFALVGGRIVAVVLGDAFAGDVGSELGRLVVAFAPWMFATVAFTLTFPLVFVLERSRFLVAVALAALALHVPITLVLRAAFGLEGIAIALAVTTFGVLIALSAGVSKRMLALTVLGLGQLALAIGALAGLSFGVAAIALGGFPGAALGLAAYGALLALWRPRGLRDAWTYVRALN